jgi:hypothetical protein
VRYELSTQALAGCRFALCSRQPKLPAQHFPERVSRVGMNISKPCSPNPFRHDGLYFSRP